MCDLRRLVDFSCEVSTHDGRASESRLEVYTHVLQSGGGDWGLWGDTIKSNRAWLLPLVCYLYCMCVCVFW